MYTTLSDNPGPVAAGVGALLSTLIAALQGFGVIHITAEQVGLLMALYAALSGLAGLLLRLYSVPRTPSTTSAALVQSPPPGTVLVTTDAARAKSAVPAGSVVAGPTP